MSIFFLNLLQKLPFDVIRIFLELDRNSAIRNRSTWSIFQRIKTLEEYSLIREHPAIGAKIMESVGLPEVTFKALYEHHENQNGGGYPFDLKGNQVSLAARIVAVADHFDALTSERPYRKGMSMTSQSLTVSLLTPCAF